MNTVTISVETDDGHYDKVRREGESVAVALASAIYKVADTLGDVEVHVIAEAVAKARVGRASSR